jgi:hypothetical protein
MAKGNVHEDKLDLIRWKSRKDPLCLIDGSAQMNRKITRLQLFETGV